MHYDYYNKGHRTAFTLKESYLPNTVERERVRDRHDHSNSYAQGLKRLFSEREGVRDNTSHSYTAMELR